MNSEFSPSEMKAFYSLLMSDRADKSFVPKTIYALKPAIGIRVD